jgi:hypothetical protein
MLEGRTVLFLEVPPFDVLTGQQAPYSGFGETIVLHSELPSRYLQTVDQAVVRMSEVFRINCRAGRETVIAIEDAISQMWAESWNPQKANINLFTTDFGCVLIDALKSMLPGCLVLRSETDLSHTSLWWAKAKVEAFPFHKTYKRFLKRDGESLTFFAERLVSLVGLPGETE